MSATTVYVLTVCSAEGACDLLGVFTTAEAARVRADEYCRDSSDSECIVTVGEWGIYLTPEGCDMADLVFSDPDEADETWFNITRATLGESMESQVGISI